MRKSYELHLQRRYLLRKYAINEAYGGAYEVHGGVPRFVIQVLKAIDWAIKNLQDKNGIIRLPKWYQIKKWIKIGKLFINIIRPK